MLSIIKKTYAIALTRVASDRYTLCEVLSKTLGIRES